MFTIRLSVRENAASREALYRAGIDQATVRAALADDSAAWIAEEEGRAVGFSMADRGDGSVFALFVRPGCEGRGHGGALLDAAVDWLRAGGIDSVSLAVGPNTRAHRFYLKRGWIETGREENGDVALQPGGAAGSKRQDTRGR